MLQNLEFDIRDQRIRDLEKQCNDNECLIQTLQNSHNMSLCELNEMHIRLNEEQANVIDYLTEIVTLNAELANIKSLAKK